MERVLIWAQGFETIFLSEAINVFAELVNGCNIVGFTGEVERKDIFVGDKKFLISHWTDLIFKWLITSL